LRIQAECDLHGLTQAQARVALSQFLQACRRQRCRCVRIIHGKGLGSPNQQPVLKIQVNRWLRQRSEVLAFCAAPSHDGGQGALYVLVE
jgi:DNA-nicking Smr family endonuclease